QHGHAAAAQNGQHPDAAEEVQRTAHVFEQEANRKQIEEDAEGAADAVMALASLAVHIADGNLADRGSVPACQRGNEAVHFAVKRDVLDDLSAIGLEGSSEVVNVHAGEFGHEPIGAARRNAAQNEVVNALFAPAGDNVIAFIELFQEGGNVIGIVLQVAIHGKDELARGMIESGRQSRRLTEVAPQLDDQHAAVDRGDLFEQLVSAVA